MTARAALGGRATRHGLGALLTVGGALLGCGRIELGSHAVGDGSGDANGSSAGNGGDRVLERQLDSPPAVGFDGVGVTSTAGQLAGAGGAASVSLYPTRGPGSNPGGTATIDDLDSSTVVTLERDAGSTDAGDGVVERLVPAEASDAATSMGFL